MPRPSTFPLPRRLQLSHLAAWRVSPHYTPPIGFYFYRPRPSTFPSPRTCYARRSIKAPPKDLPVPSMSPPCRSLVPPSHHKLHSMHSTHIRGCIYILISLFFHTLPFPRFLSFTLPPPFLSPPFSTSLSTSILPQIPSPTSLPLSPYPPLTYPPLYHTLSPYPSYTLLPTNPKQMNSKSRTRPMVSVNTSYAIVADYVTLSLI